MKLGFVFPGQGSQFVGMGKDYYEKYECVREVYNKANQILVGVFKENTNNQFCKLILKQHNP